MKGSYVCVYLKIFAPSSTDLCHGFNKQGFNILISQAQRIPKDAQIRNLLSTDRLSPLLYFLS